MKVKSAGRKTTHRKPNRQSTVERIRVSIVDDDSNLRSQLSWLLNHSDSFLCTGAYKTSDEALEGIESEPPDVVLLDIGLTNESGIDCLQRIVTSYPNIRVLMLTVYSDDEKIFQSIRFGAIGYMLKKTPPEKLLEAIKDAHAGGAPMSGEIAKKVLTYFRQPQPFPAEEQLSQREVQVLEALKEGYSYKSIADKLFVSVNTVSFHLRNIYAKLHVRSRAEAVAVVMKRKLF
jgi:DNA-binding NarL/FixJ family response regulator